MEEKLKFARETLAQFYTIEDVAMFATTILFSVVPTDKVALTILEGNTLRSVSTIGEKVAIGLKLGHPSVNARTVKTRQTQLVNDTQKDPDYFPGNSSDSVTMLSELCVPMIQDGKVLGTVNFEDHQVNHFSEEDAETAEAFTREITEAIHRVWGKKALAEGPRAMYQVKTRSTMDRYHDLLRAVYKGETVLNRILNRTVIPWKPGKDMVDDLVTKGYLVRERSTGRRYSYRITEEGIKALKTYDGIIERFGELV
jgi:putative methionine-R-sulfoxide reductase with GAF domain/predicted transcriptional regulator